MYQRASAGPRADGDGAHRQGGGGEERAVRAGLHPRRVEEAPVQQPTEARGTAVLRPAEGRRASIPPDASFDSLKDRIVQALINQQRQGQMQKVIDELAEAGQPQDRPAPAAGRGGRRAARRADRRTRQITIVEFSDFECPYCGAAHDTVEQVMQQLRGQGEARVPAVPAAASTPTRRRRPRHRSARRTRGSSGSTTTCSSRIRRSSTSTDLKAYAASVGLDGAKFGQCLEQR